MSLWYNTLRKMVAWGLQRYFREIVVHGSQNIPRSGAVLFTVNHQNAFLDALLIVTTNKRLTNFLARADVFKFSLAQGFFRSLNMMPIYRWRDGRHGLSNNHFIFDHCKELLNRQEALMMFPEANHHQFRRLLPLSKGFTRITSGVDQKNNPLKIVPVGINYTHHRRLGGSVSIVYGKPISPPSLDAGSRTYVSQLRDQVSESMQKLITHITPGPKYQVLEDYLNSNPWDYQDPEKCNAWIKENENGVLEPSGSPSNNGIIRKIMLGISFFFNLPPLVLCEGLLRCIGDPVFTSSIKSAGGSIYLPYLLPDIRAEHSILVWSAMGLGHHFHGDTNDDA